MSVSQEKPLRVAYILATGKKGCTYHFGEHFLSSLDKAGPTEVTRFVLPNDAPPCCTGCMACFNKGMESCPHHDKVRPIWQSMLKADLIVFAQPTYIMGAPGQVKVLLDHLACRWLVHSPDPQMLSKRVLIISQAVGMGARKAGKMVKSSLRMLGAAKIRMFTFTVQNGIYDSLSDKRREKINGKLERLAKTLSKDVAPLAPSLFARMMFPMMRLGHTMISKQEVKQGREATNDYLYWQEQGWIDKRYPWKK